MSTFCNPVAAPFQTFVRETQDTKMNKAQRMIIIRLAISIAFIVSDLAIGLSERISILLYVAAYIVIGADIVLRPCTILRTAKCLMRTF